MLSSKKEKNRTCKGFTFTCQVLCLAEINSKKFAAKDTFRSLCLRRRTYSGVRRVLVRGRIAAVRPQSAPCDESPERLGSDMPKRPFRRNAQKNDVSGAAAGVDTASHIIDLQKSLLQYTGGILVPLKGIKPPYRSWLRSSSGDCAER